MSVCVRHTLPHVLPIIWIEECRDVMMPSCVERRATPREELWSRFKALAYNLKHVRANGNGCSIDINEWRMGSNVLFRVERRGAQTKAVALTASPEIEADDRLMFRVHTVTVVNGSVSGVPAERLPVAYDARGKRFTIETTPPIEETQMAEFFLQRAERLLDGL